MRDQMKTAPNTVKAPPDIKLPRTVDISKLGGGYIGNVKSNNPYKIKKGLIPCPKGGSASLRLSPTLKKVFYDESLRNTANIQQGIILDETISISCNPSYDGLLLNGWDIDTVGGGIDYPKDGLFRLVDTDTNAAVSMSRHIVPQSTGIVITEAVLGINNALNAGSKFQLMKGDSVSVDITLTSDSITVALDGGIACKVAEQTPGEVYGIKLVTDFTSQTMSVYVDGILGLDKAKYVGTYDSIRIATSKKGTGILCIGYLLMHKGYSVNERFITALAGFLPDDWSSALVGNASISVVNLDSQAEPDFLCLNMDNNGKDNEASIYRPFDKITEPIYFEFNFRADKGKDNLIFRAMSEMKTVMLIQVKNGVITYIDAIGNAYDIYNYPGDMHFVITVTASLQSDRATVSVNHKIRGEELKLNASADGFDGISFSTGYIAESSVYLDDIQVRPILPTPADYVAKPVPINTGDFQVGVMSCSLWRATDHLGWDRVNGYPKRIPVLGFYEDGNPELADWETKYMVEHGISFQMYCWYRPSRNIGHPIKKPLHSEALHEGYFKSKYKDSIRFAINYIAEGGSVKDRTDFRSNVMPFLIEYYFKDSRYLIIDNKPVMALYSHTDLLKDLHCSVAELKKDLDYFRSLCRKEGFDGIYLLGQNPLRDSSISKDLYACGFDYIYTYSWGRKASAAAHICMMNDMTEFYDAKMIPLISHGWGPREWYGTKVGGTITPTDMRKIAQFVKNDYTKRYDSSSLMTKLILMDNWNEVAEGHWYTPSGSDPFTYLDILRTVFDVNPSTHTDIIPSKAQKDRIDILYPADRVIARESEPVSPLISDCNRIIKRWDFSTDTGGWTGINDTTKSVTTADGTLLIIPKQNMTTLESPEFYCKSEDIKYIRIRLNGNTAHFDGSLEYKFDSTNDYAWNAGNQYMKVSEKRKEYTEYIVDVNSGSPLDGNMIRMLIFMYSIKQPYQIVYIELLGK